MKDTDRDSKELREGDGSRGRQEPNLLVTALLGFVFLVGGFILGLFKGNDPRPSDRPGRPTTTPEGHIDQEDIEAGYEHDDVPVRGIVLALVALSIFAGVVVVGVGGLQARVTGFLPSFAPPQGVADPPTDPVPGVVESRAATGSEQAALRAAETELLNTYGWIDQEAGVVRIPIDRAMELIAERGLPVIERAEGEEPRDRGLEMPLDSSSGRAPDRVYDYWPGEE